MAADVFDGAMVILAMYTMMFFHPGPLLFSQIDDTRSTDQVEMKNASKTNTNESLA